MTPLIFVSIGVILVGAPASVFFSIFFWQLWREERALPAGEQTERLAMVMAIQMTTRTVAAVILAIPTVLYVFGADVSAWSGQAILVAIDILLLAGIMVGGYLFWLRRVG